MKVVLIHICLAALASAFTPMSNNKAPSALYYIVTSVEQNHFNHRPANDMLDMNISEESIRKHYQEWCAKFHRRQDSFRFIVFQRNYLSQFKWNLAAGRQAFTLNQFADCTEEEYNQIMKKAAENVVSGPPVRVSDALEVTVVLDENDIPASFSTPNNFIDVEVLDKSPFLSRLS